VAFSATYWEESVKSIIWAAAIRIFSAVSVYVMYMVVSNALPMAKAGEFFYLQTVVVVFGPLVLFGLHTYSLRWLAQLKGDVFNFALFSFLKELGWSLVLGFPLIVLFIFMAGVVDGVSGLLVVIVILFYSALLFLGHVLQAISRFNLALFLMHVLAPLAASCSFIVAAPTDSVDAILVFGAWLSVAVFVSLFCVISGRRRQVPKYLCRSPLRARFSFFVINLMVLLANWSGVLIVGFFLEDFDVAGVAVAQRTAVLVSFVLVVTNFVLAPKISKLYALGSMVELKHIVNLSGFVMSTFGGIGLLFFVLFGEEVLLLFGDGYGDYYALCLLLTLAQFFNVVTGNSNVLLTMTNNEVVMRNILLISGTSAFLLCLLFVDLYGVIGVGYSFCIVMILQNSLSVFYVWRTVRVNLIGFLRPTAVLAAVRFFRNNREVI
jgi:O-antigen/teichoic acid export membrane protein